MVFAHRVTDEKPVSLQPMPGGPMRLSLTYARARSGSRDARPGGTAMGIRYWASPESLTLKLPSIAPTSAVGATSGSGDPPGGGSVTHLPATHASPDWHVPVAFPQNPQPAGSGPH